MISCAFYPVPNSHSTKLGLKIFIKNDGCGDHVQTLLIVIILQTIHFNNYLPNIYIVYVLYVRWFRIMRRILIGCMLILLILHKGYEQSGILISLESWKQSFTGTEGQLQQSILMIIKIINTYNKPKAFWKQHIKKNSQVKFTELWDVQCVVGDISRRDVYLN
jgi:hypothetical protein